MKTGKSGMHEQDYCSDDTIVNESKTESEQEIKWRTVNEDIEAISPIIVPEPAMKRLRNAGSSINVNSEPVI